MIHPAQAPIVVAVADDHDAALRYAATEAVRERRPLRLVHAVPPPRGVVGPGAVGPETILLTYRAIELVAGDVLQQQYERAVTLVDWNVPVAKVLRRGPVVDVLLDQSRDAYRLVLQRRHGPQLSRILTGSTAAALAARAPVPVVSVPELWAGPRAVPHVTVALGERDVEGHCPALLASAFMEAAARHASLTVLHAIYVPVEYGELALDEATIQRWHDEARRQIEDQARTWQQQHPTVDLRIDLRYERPADGILAASRHSDLVVVGRRGSHGLVHLGSVVRAVVRGSQCPVMVLTPASREQGRRATVEAQAARL
jgi:nucleotide-binding universal stress UspA family protein